MLAATAAGSPPDAYRGWAWIVGDAAIGALTNLQPYVDAADVDLMDFWPATLNQMKYQGDVHAMSISTIVQFMYYNKDRMREGGLDPDNPPTTIAELDEQGAALNDIADDGEILRLGFSPTLPGKQVWEWGAAFGSQYWDEAEGNIALDEEAWVELLNWYKGYGDKFGVENLAGYASTYGGNGFGRNSPQGIYYTGLISFWVIGSWLFNDMGEYGPDVDFGVIPIPDPGGRGRRHAGHFHRQHVLRASQLRQPGRRLRLRQLHELVALCGDKQGAAGQRHALAPVAGQLARSRRRRRMDGAGSRRDPAQYAGETELPWQQFPGPRLE